VRLHQQSVLELPVDPAADIVFSVGLVEHFNPAQTREAVLAHFNLLKPGGVAIITFPTPTALYRLARRLIEMAGMWKFPDERPLRPREVIDAIVQRGDLLWQKTLLISKPPGCVPVSELTISYTYWSKRTNPSVITSTLISQIASTHRSCLSVGVVIPMVRCNPRRKL
jgi:SAM-dependent methyltransferase